MIRVVQTHTVWFERPFLLWLGTLLPDYTILGKLDSRSRTPKPDSEAGLTRNWAISQFVSKYTVLFLEPIRSLLDPSRVSHTIIGTSDSSRLTSEAGLTQNWAISQFVSKYTVLFLEPIRSLLDPFRVPHTIVGTSDSSRLPRNHPNLGYHSECSTKYTVLYLELIRPLLDPFRVSHTIIGTSDDREGYRGQYPPLRLYLGPDGRLALQPVIRVTN